MAGRDSADGSRGRSNRDRGSRSTSASTIAARSERTELHLAWLGIVKILAYGVSVGIICLALYPAVQALAGRNTGLSVNIALGLTATVSLAGVTTYARARRLAREVKRLEARNIFLEGEVQKERAMRLRGATSDTK